MLIEYDDLQELPHCRWLSNIKSKIHDAHEMKKFESLVFGAKSSLRLNLLRPLVPLDTCLFSRACL